MSNIEESLKRLFDKHRIVFWFDTERELRDDFEKLAMADIEKVELCNNEFSVKHRILREDPDQRFLLYCHGPQPADQENWLLDLLLSHVEFRTDQASMYLADLGLGPEFSGLVQEHVEFFRSGQRVASLKEMLQEKDSHQMIRLKMLAVCTGSEARIDMILESLLAEQSEDRSDKFKCLQRSGLDSFLWEQLEKQYGYRSKEKSIQDFKIVLFKSCYSMEMDQTTTLTNESIIFLKRWKDSIRHKDVFEKSSDECADILGIEKDLLKRDYSSLLEVDYFRLVDKKIISDLVRAVVEQTISAGQCAMVVRDRRLTHWYPEYAHLYEAVEYGSSFLNELGLVELKIDSFSGGIKNYCRSWFRLDQLYRKYNYHRREAGSPALLEALTVQIEDLYTNNFLLKANDGWQQQVDMLESWQKFLVPLQNSFFRTWIAPFGEQKKKVYVIISDALRYEVGEELFRVMRMEDRYQAELETMVSMLPSYTQLGMAALLPHKELGFSGGENLTVFADGMPSAGTQNRGKILNAGVPGGGAAVKADVFLEMERESCRALMRENDVLYIYHNRIDAVGDKQLTESGVFEAVEEALKELVKIIKKLAGNNATNMIVTSDHGFIYQARNLDASDYSSAEVRGEQILQQDRRFVIGKGLEEHGSLKRFTAGQLGLTGEMDVQISKSINRMRVKGSGSRFVHGGSSLQEIVIPVLKINKKRKSDVSNVSVDLIGSGSTVITSGQLSVAFYQAEPVVDKVMPRTLRAGIYSKDGELISDSHEMIFDFTSKEARERERKVRFLFNRKADDANGQTVFLRLEEKVHGTAQYKEYKTFNYTIQRSFMTDF